MDNNSRSNWSQQQQTLEQMKLNVSRVSDINRGFCLVTLKTRPDQTRWMQAYGMAWHGSCWNGRSWSMIRTREIDGD